MTKSLELVLESEVFCSAFMALGSGLEVPDDILPDVEKFVCALYDSAPANMEMVQLILTNMSI